MKIAAHLPVAYIDGSWVAQVFTSVVVRTQWTGGTTIETLTPTPDGVGGAYCNTTDALYADATEYFADWHSTILGIAQIGTVPFWHRAAAGVLPTAPPALACTGTTATTAAFVLTPPVDVHYFYSALLYMAPGDSAYTVVSPFVSGTLSGLTANTNYSAVAVAYNTAGLPSLPSSPPVLFTTPLSDGGALNVVLDVRTDNAVAAEKTDNLDVTVNYHRTPIDIRGNTCQLRYSFSRAGKNVQIDSITLAGDLLSRRRD